MFIYYLFKFFVGSCFASHACVIYDRFNDIDFIFSRSRCSFCLQQLSLTDEVPILSYFLLNGKCRYCKNYIPVELLFFELIGGISFLKIPIYSSSTLINIFFLFSLLLITIFDYFEREFPTILLSPLFLLSLLHINKFQLISLIEVIPIIILLIILVTKKQLGSGDLLIYLALVLFYSGHTANLLLLIASLLALIHYVFMHNKLNKQLAFVPYLYYAIIINSFL